MLSLTCKASIKAVIFLGSKLSEGGRYSLKEVAAFIGENEHTVGKLLQRLVKAGIINSVKGPKGGFFMTPRQTEQRVIKIVKAIDGDDVFTQCSLGLKECSDARPCPFHKGYKPIREGFRKLCHEKRVRELYENVNNGNSFLVS
jgi:Rrf2 family protein